MKGMKIESVRDLKDVVAVMHDSEFNEKDYGFKPEKKMFFLESRAFRSQEHLRLELYNIEEYRPAKNEEKIWQGKGIAGVFNYIRIRKHGLKLTLVSQDLRIVMILSKLEGELTRDK